MFKKLAIFLFVCFAAGYLFHKPLVLLGAKTALPKELHYEWIGWEDGSIVLRGIQWQTTSAHLRADSAMATWNGSFFPLCLTPKITLVHPHIDLLTLSCSSPAAPFMRSRYFKPQWEVQNGVLQILSRSRLYFAIDSGKNPHEMGSLSVYSDPTLNVKPLFTAQFAEEDAAIAVHFSLEERELSRLLPLASLLFHEMPRSWDRAHGELSLHGDLTFDPHRGVTHVACKGYGEEITLLSQAVGLDLACNRFEADFSLPPSWEWRDLEGALLVRGLDCTWQQTHRVQSVNGSAQWIKEKEPAIAFEGFYLKGDKQLPFALSGKGQIEPDRRFWSELDLKCMTSEYTLSCCSEKRGDYVIQLHAKEEGALTGMTGSLSGDATLFYSGGKWQMQEAHVALDQVSYDKRQITELTGALALENSQLKTGELTGVWNGLKGTISLTDAEVNSDGLYVGGEGTIEGGRLRGNARWKFAPEFTLEKGVFASDLLAEASYAPLIERLLPAMQLHGMLVCSGQWLPGSIDLAVQGENLQVVFPYVAIAIPKIEKEVASLHYDMATQLWSGAVPLENAQVYCERYRAPFDHVEGTVEIDGRHLRADGLYAECHSLALRGDVGLEIQEKGEVRLTLQTAQMGGEMQSLLAAVRHFTDLPQFTPAIQGSFSSGEEGLSLVAKIGGPNPGVNWRATGRFEEVSFPVNQTTRFREVSCTIDFDSVRQRLTLHGAKGTWALQDGTPLKLSLSRFSTTFSDLPTLDFEMVLEEGSRQLAHVEGSARKTPQSSWILDFQQEKTHILGIPLRINLCELGENMRLSAFEMQPVFLCDQFHKHVALLQNAGMLSASFSTQNLEEWNLKGTVAAHLYSENAGRGFSFKAKSEDLYVRGRAWPSFSVSGVKVGDRWLIEKLEAKGLFLSGAMIVDSEGIRFPELKGTLEGATLRGNAYLHTEKKQFGLNLDTLEKGPFQAQGKITGDYSQALALAGELALQCHTEHFKLDSAQPISFTYSTKEGLVSKSCALKAQVSHFETLSLDQLQVTYDRDLLTVRTKTQIHDQPLWAALQYNCVGRPCGLIRLSDQEGAEGLKVHFMNEGNQVLWERLEGSCYGIRCALEKKGPLLSGEVSFDGSKLAALLPLHLRNVAETWKWGSGYTWRGDLSFTDKGWIGAGTIAGEDFELLGYRFRSLSGGMKIEPERISFMGVKIRDAGGAIDIDAIDFRKMASWNLAIPKIQARLVQPSLLRKTDGSISTVKPFTVENFELSEVRAKLDDLATLEASGTLFFTNAAKKQSSFFDVPLDLIKNMGIDPGLLTPIQGEFEIELRGDKFYLMALKKSFSEGRRSEFYISPERELSYVDLSGKVSIDLKMRQDVLLRWTEPFILTIRGSLEKPRYGLDY